MLFVGACAFAPDREGLRSSDQDAAKVAGFEHARAWADGSLDDFKRSLISPRLVPSRIHDVNYLALSAGGAGGAFSVGVLNGWSASGSRPDFDIVSGVSIGALIAPFAFLGPDYDSVLKEVFTSENLKSLANLQNPIAVLTSGGVLDSTSLRQLVERYSDARLLAAIAEEHRKGRRLLVTTTNLDAQRPVVWDLGAIASSGRLDALTIFHEVLLASASVPGAYAPVLIKVTNGRREFREMHVDGATTNEVFIAPELLLPQGGVTTRRAGKIHLWVVINNTLMPEYAVTKIAPVPIALRSLSTLTKSQTTWIVKAAREKATNAGMDFNLAFIDRVVPYDNSKPFAADYIGAVYQLGYAGAVSGSLWQKTLTSLGQFAADSGEQSSSMVAAPSAPIR